MAAPYVAQPEIGTGRIRADWSDSTGTALVKPDGTLATGPAAYGSTVAPNPPTNVQAFAGPASVTATWLAPTVGQPTGYTVTLSPGGASTSVSGLTATISGLTNGTAYTASVVATNGGGNSTSASATAVTPKASGLTLGTVPSALTGVTTGQLFAWYAADQLPSPPANTVALSSGSGGTGIFLNDASGNGHNIATASSPPTMVTSWTNSKPAMLFDGAGNFLNLPFGLDTLGGIFSLFAICDLTAAVNGSSQNDMRLISNNGTSAQERGWEVDAYGNGSTTNTFREIFQYNAMQSATITTATPYAYSAVYGLAANGGGFRYIKGTKDTTGGGVLSAQPPLAINLTIGGQSGGIKLWKGRIAEIILFQGALSDTDRHAVESYIGTKYALTMAVQ